MLTFALIIRALRKRLIPIRIPNSSTEYNFYKSQASTSHSWITALGIVVMLLSPSTYAFDDAFFSNLDNLQTLLKVPHTKMHESMIIASQKWRRQKGVERWDITKGVITKDIKEKCLKILNDMGLSSEIKPAKNKFDYILILGATAPRMKRRLNQVIRLWDKVITAKNIVFLTGQRPLTPKVDQIFQLMEKAAGPNPSELSKPENETEAAKMVWHSSLTLPEEMEDLGCMFVDTPRIWSKKDKQWQRPNTRDTLKQWMKTNPSSGTVLIISDQPHAYYQEIVVNQELPKSFITSLAAESADADTDFFIYLDALALWLYNYYKDNLDFSGTSS